MRGSFRALIQAVAVFSGWVFCFVCWFWNRSFWILYILFNLYYTLFFLSQNLFLDANDRNLTCLGVNSRDSCTQWEYTVYLDCRIAHWLFLCVCVCMYVSRCVSNSGVDVRCRLLCWDWIARPGICWLSQAGVPPSPTGIATSLALGF